MDKFFPQLNLLLTGVAYKTAYWKPKPILKIGNQNPEEKNELRISIQTKVL